MIVNNHQNKPQKNQSFKALPAASTTIINKGIKSEIQILKLGVEDIEFLEELKTRINMKKLLPKMKDTLDFDYWQKTIDEGLNSAMKRSVPDKFLAVMDNCPCGILTFGEEYGTESLKYIASWPTKPDNQVKNVGKSLMRHFFEIMQNRKSVEAVVYPELHSPVDIVGFYEKLGFKSSPVTYWKMQAKSKDVSFGVKALDKLFSYKKSSSKEYIDLFERMDMSFK